MTRKRGFFVGAVGDLKDEKVKYDGEDPIAGYLSEKIIGQHPIIVSEGTEEGENKILISIVDLCSIISACSVIQDLINDVDTVGDEIDAINQDVYDINDEIEEMKDALGYNTFITEWDMDEGDFILPIGVSYSETYKTDIEVNWGDGTSSVIRYPYTEADRTHYYTANTYQIKIKGVCQRWIVGSTHKLKKVIQWGNVSFEYLRFQECTYLQSIPNSPLTGIENLTTAYYMFYRCSGLNQPIPLNFFKYGKLINSVERCFSDSGFNGEIPEDVFWGTPNLEFASAVFYNNANLTGSIPENLFKFTPKLKNASWLVHSCTGLTGTIPENLFKYVPLLESVVRTFQNCAGLTGQIPSLLFRENPLLNSAYETFMSCVGLTSVGNYLFRYNPLINSFRGTFRGCDNLVYNKWIFYASGEESSRFGSISTVNFYQCFSISLENNHGEAPEIWNCALPGSTVTLQCFSNHSSNTLSNYGSIPVEWK